MDAGLVGWHSIVAGSGAELLQHHQHFLLEPLLVFLLVLQVVLPFQHGGSAPGSLCVQHPVSQQWHGSQEQQEVLLHLKKGLHF